MTTPPVRLLLVDDEELVRTGIRLILRRMADIDVVAEAADGAQAVELARSHPVDVALVDIRMPGVDGLETCRRLVALEHPPKVVMLTTFGDQDNVIGALRAGALGFLLKETGPHELISAVRAAAAGDAVLSPAVTAHVVHRMLDSPGSSRQHEERLRDLTERERQVLALLGVGLSNTEIGRRLDIGSGTVKTHVARILEKTGTTSRVQAAVLAGRAGLLDG
ncbi:response regulator [Streptomyces sp. NPDC050161]|uniref:response regulator n=1 Tax=Streptomyces sp. NPDC050161 TaxID=3365604 RepID=UPI0037AABB91